MLKKLNISFGKWTAASRSNSLSSFSFRTNTSFSSVNSMKLKIFTENSFLNSNSLLQKRNIWWRKKSKEDEKKEEQQKEQDQQKPPSNIAPSAQNLNKPPKKENESVSQKLVPPEGYDANAERMKLERYMTAYYHRRDKIPTPHFFPRVSIVMRSYGKKKGNTQKSEIVFRVPKNQGKMDIRNYLKQIYNYNVVRVNTATYNAKWGRTTKGKATIKRKTFKKAWVTILPKEETSQNS